MTRRITISLTVIFGILMLLSAAEAEGDRALIAKAEQISDDRFTLTTSTPKGATVYAIDQPSQAVWTAIDTGLTDLFAVACRNNGYRKYLDYSDYTIFIARPDRFKDSWQIFTRYCRRGRSICRQCLRQRWIYLRRGNGNILPPRSISHSRAHQRPQSCIRCRAV